MNRSIITAVLGTVLISTACNETKDPLSGKVKPALTKKVRKRVVRSVQPKTTIMRHVVDLTDDYMSAIALLKVDRELPVIEIIASDKWEQSDYDLLPRMSMLESLKLNKVSLTELNLSFVTKVKALSELSLSGADDKALLQLKGSKIKELNLTASNKLTTASIEVLKSMRHLKKLSIKNHPQAAEFRQALNIEVLID